MASFVFSTSAKEFGDSGKEPPDGGGGGPRQQKTSFRDMVLGNREKPPERIKKDLFKEKLAHIEFEDNNPLKSRVHIDESVLEGLCDPWRDALVVKLLGKSIGYNTLRDRLTRLWKLVAGFEIMDLGNDFFMVKFEEEIDRSKVMDEGPWMVFDRYLTVQTWSPEFMSPAAKIDKTMVLIRFPGLIVFYYDESILLALAAVVGTPIKVDQNTLDVKRGRFAWICVEVDLNKPVGGKVWFRNFWYKVEYEGLHRICSLCGCYGHLGRECPSKKNKEADQQGTQAPAPATELHPQAVAPENLPVTEHNQEHSMTNQNVTVLPQESLHGDWMIVKRKKCNNRVANPGKDSAKNKGVSYNNDRKDKMHAERSTSKNHAKKGANDFNKEGTAPSKKIVGPSKTPQSNHKRPRKEGNEVPAHSNKNVPFASNVAPPAPRTFAMQGSSIPKVYDIGFGAKSTVKMKAVSGSRFMFVNDGDAMEESKDEKRGSNAEMVSQEGPHVDMVPETQLDVQMAI